MTIKRYPSRNREAVTAALFLLLLQLAPARAQSDVDGFNPGANGTIFTVAIQADGKILVGGNFTTLGGGGAGTTTRNHIGRLNPDGSLDANFDPGANGSVLVIVLQPDGKILVGGDFTALGGGGFGTTVRNHLGRLNPDGTLDSTFNPNISVQPGNTVEALAVQTDGKILLGGAFIAVGGTQRQNIARVNANGTLDTLFNPNSNGEVKALALQPDNQILVGGAFTLLGANFEFTRNRIARLNPDGTVETGFDPGANSVVFDLTLQADAKILVGGAFTTVGGGGTGDTTRNFLGRLNSDGSLDSFNPGASSTVATLVVQPDGKILVGGFFNALGGGTGTTTRNFLGRVNADGTLDSGFDPGANSSVLALAVQSDSKILAGGNFTALGGGGTGTTQRFFIGRLGSAAPPVIISPLSATATLGQQFTYQFEATGATALDVANLPGGLTFDPSLSALVGTPTVAGTFQVGLTASNSDGTTRATLTLIVQPAPSAGPIIVSGTAATGRTGLPFSFQVLTSGATIAARLSAMGLPTGLSVDPITGLISGIVSADGSFSVKLTVTDGKLTATATLELTFSADPALPVITSSDTATLVPGQFFSYQIVAPSSDTSDPPTYAVAGQLPPGLGLDPVTGTISGTFQGFRALVPGPALSGGVVTNVQLFATNSHGTGTLPLLFVVAPNGALNISTRLAVGTSDDVLIGGFIITGNAPKKLLIRAIGPSLANAVPPVPDPLADPVLELHFPDGSIVTNDNWKATQQAEIEATGIPPSNDLESALIAILAPRDSSITGSGSYTVIVRGKNNGTGVGLVEIYDLGTASFDISSRAQLANISTRGKVQTDADVMIGGFILGGSTASDVLLRAIGPSLSDAVPPVPGALQDTVLELHDGDGSLITSNDDWESDQKQQIIDTGIPPVDPRESAIIANLTPGNYTAIVRGKNNTTGVALVEAYVLQ